MGGNLNNLLERLRDYENCNDNDVDMAADLLQAILTFDQPAVRLEPGSPDHHLRLMRGAAESLCWSKKSEEFASHKLAEIEEFLKNDR